MNNISKPFYFGSYLIATLIGIPLTVVPLIVGGGQIEEEHLPFVILGGLISIYTLVVMAILVYKMWKAIPASIARTTPGKAVGFLFIPLFNLYWWFVALWGWSQDWNTYSDQSEGQIPSTSEGLPLCIAIFGAIGGSIGTICGFAGIPWLGTLIASPNYVLIPLFIFLVCDLLNKAPSLPSQAEAGQAPVIGTSSLGVASMVLGILSIMLPYIGIICGIVAIILAAMQRNVRHEGFSTAGLVTGIIGTSLWGLIILLIMILISQA